LSFYDSEVTPERMFQRQIRKAHILADALTHLQIGPGDRVLDVGSGPGYGSLRLAQVVGPEGRVFALDASALALEYLEARCREEGVTWVTAIAADAADFHLPAPGANRFAVIDMLHDAEDPAAILRCLAHELPIGAVGVVLDFQAVPDPQSGPGADIRIAESRLRDLLLQSQFVIDERWYPPDGRYAFLVRRAPEVGGR